MQQRILGMPKLPSPIVEVEVVESLCNGDRANPASSSHSPRPSFSFSSQPESRPQHPCRSALSLQGLTSTPSQQTLSPQLLLIIPPSAPRPHAPFLQPQIYESTSNVPSFQPPIICSSIVRDDSHAPCLRTTIELVISLRLWPLRLVADSTGCFVAAYPCETARNLSTPTLTHLLLDLARVQVFRKTVRLLPLKSCPLEGKMQQASCLLL